jgi:FkbM family methyltransferase
MLKKFQPYIESSGVSIRGILHIGANDCEEREEYIQAGLTDEQLVFIDPLGDLLEYAVKEHATLQALPVCLYSSRCQRPFYLTSNPQCCSLYPLSELHQEIFKDVSIESEVTVECFDLDSLLRENIKTQYNTLIINVNGAEIEVLKGAQGMLKNHIDFIIVTSFNIPLLTGAPLSRDCEKWMETQGFFAIIQDKLNEGTSQVLYAKQSVALQAAMKHMDKTQIPQDSVLTEIFEDTTKQ